MSQQRKRFGWFGEVWTYEDLIFANIQQEKARTWEIKKYLETGTTLFRDGTFKSSVPPTW